MANGLTEVIGEGQQAKINWLISQQFLFINILLNEVAGREEQAIARGVSKKLSL